MSVLAAEWGTGQVFWSILWFFVFFIWIWMLIAVFGDIFRSRDLSGVAKAVWLLLIIVLPYLGVFLYLIIRGRKMSEHAHAQMQAQEDAFRQYVRQAAGSTSAADELEKLARLRDQGVLNEQEYAQAKARVLS